MRLSIFSMNQSSNKLTPQKSDKSQSEEQVAVKTDSLSKLRAYVLNRLYVVACVLGVLAYLMNFVIQPTGANRLVLAGYAFVLALVVIAALARKLPLAVRTGVLLLALFAVGLGDLLTDGLYGSGRVYLLALPFIAALLIGRGGRTGALILSLLTLTLVGAAMSFGWWPAPQLRIGTGNSSLYSWLTALISFSLLAVSGAASYGLVVEGLNRNLEQQKSLIKTLDNERRNLEQKLEARTRDLERRLVQIHTAAEITRAISRMLDINVLLPQVCELIRQRFNLYYVGIFLIEPGRAGDEAQNYAVLKAGTGEAGQAMLAAGHRLAVGGDSMIGWATAHSQPRIALDVGAEATRFDNPHLPLTRSELALPILTSEAGQSGEARVLGAITIQSTQEAAFDADDITVLQGIADGLASAIENARLFSAMQESLNEVRSLHRQYLESAWGRATRASELSYTFERAEPTSAGLVETPVAAEATSADLESSPQLEIEAPLRLRDQVIGSLTLEREPSAGAAWSDEELALIETVANQAALALENARLLQETRRMAEAERTAAGIASKLWTTSDVDAILRTALRELSASLNAQEGMIELWPDGKRVVGAPGEEATHA
jgi:GAF domain-containing protein